MASLPVRRSMQAASSLHKVQSVTRGNGFSIPWTGDQPRRARALIDGEWAHDTQTAWETKRCWRKDLLSMHEKGARRVLQSLGIANLRGEIDRAIRESCRR